MTEEKGFANQANYSKDRQLDDLKKELEYFQKEKERVRSIVGQIGSVPTQRTKIFNILFIIIVISCVPLSLIVEGKLQHLIFEIAIAAISIKLIYIIHNQGRVNHFQLWILTSIEWRMNEMMREIGMIKKSIANSIENVAPSTDEHVKPARKKADG